MQLAERGMIMIRFECDYAEGAHPQVMKMLNETNFEQTPGYGEDIYCEKAKKIIQALCETPEADVHFLIGGTPANITVIASILRPHQGVISAVSGHIGVHETGAVESTGHKVLTVPSDNGKITPQQIKEVYDLHWNDVNHEHMVQPGMVYLSNPTENGTLYTKEELTQISKVCRECQLPLYLDGARMGYGLMAEGYDLTLPDIAKLCDIFYIGGTKVGALFGEAVVIPQKALQKDFRYHIKQNRAMLAKGRLLGIQFVALLEDGLYFSIAKHADQMAQKIKDALGKKGYGFRYDSITNQQFPIMPRKHLAVLKEKYAFSFWEPFDEEQDVVRFCTSWATKEEDVLALIADIEKL